MSHCRGHSSLEQLKDLEQTDADNMKCCKSKRDSSKVGDESNQKSMSYTISLPEFPGSPS